MGVSYGLGDGRRMQAASAESVVDGVEPRGALPMPPTDSGETDSPCGARDALSSKRGAVCVVCEERAHTEDSLPDAPFSLPFSSSSSISAATFVSTSSSRSYLLETFVDLTSPLRSVLLREFETIQSDSPYASNARWGQSVGPQTHGTNAALAAAGFSFGNPLAETVQPYAMKAVWGQGVGRQAHGAE